MTVADRIGVMDQGRLEQVASPRELYEAPNSRWIADRRRRQPVRGRGRRRRGGPPGGCDPRRRNHHGRRAERTHYETDRQRRDPPGKIKLSRRGPASDAVNAHSINRLEGVVTEVSYLAVSPLISQLDTGAVLRSSMAKTTRLDVDAYSVSHRVIAWFAPDDCVVLEQ